MINKHTLKEALWAFAIFVTAILVISLIAPYLPNWLFWIPSH